MLSVKDFFTFSAYKSSNMGGNVAQSAPTIFDGRYSRIAGRPMPPLPKGGTAEHSEAWGDMLPPWRYDYGWQTFGGGKPPPYDSEM